MKKAIYLKISGTVQGVFFRQSTQQKARELNIKGWVRNCNDGSVEVEAEGEEIPLNDFVEWCHRGPRDAKVNNVESKNIEMKNFEGFEVRSTKYE